MNGKRLYKSSDDVVVSGILGGLAEYWNTDPTIIRLLFVLLSLGGLGVVLLILYIIGDYIIPYKPKKKKRRNK